MLRICSVIFVAIGVAACGGRVQGVLQPLSAPDPDAAQVEMLVATTRADLSGRPAEMFGSGRSPELNYADIAVSIPPDAARKAGEIQWPSKLPADPKREFATLRADRIDQAEALRRFHARVARTPHRSVTVFVHGYNTKFEDSVYRFAQIIHDSKAPTLPVLFTWPSRGALLGYGYDRESANYSRDSLEAILSYLAKDKAVGEITLLAHSMGNWVAVEALRQMAIRTGRIAPKIKHVMLAAPDVDVDVFRRQIRAIGDNRPSFTVMVSQDDRALSLSRQVWGSTARLGQINPTEEPYRTQLAGSRIEVIDLTAEKTSDSLHHGKFAQSPMVVRMIGQQIAGQKMTESNGGIGDAISLTAAQTAGAVGRAAGLAVSVPLAVIDPATREGLGDQLDDIGERLGAPKRER